MAGFFDRAIDVSSKARISFERALGIGSAQRHTSVAAWDVVREAQHDLKLARHELSTEERARLTRAESQWMIHFGVPFGLSSLAGFVGTRFVPTFYFGGKSSIVLVAGYIAVAVGRERSASHVEEMCTQHDGPLARAMVASRQELEREVRTRRYDVYNDIFKGATKR
jgi:hypothetical protein